jgi:hypothetical protein
LLEAGASVELKNNDGCTPLHLAAEGNPQFALEMVQWLLDAKAEVNARDNDNKTPLHKAAAKGNERVVKKLLRAGTEVNAKDDYDKTPLHEAVVNRNPVVIRMLLKAKADIFAKDDYGHTPSDYCRREDEELIGLIKTPQERSRTSGKSDGLEELRQKICELEERMSLGPPWSWEVRGVKELEKWLGEYLPKIETLLMSIVSKIEEVAVIAQNNLVKEKETQGTSSAPATLLPERPGENDKVESGIPVVKNP